MKKLCLGFLSFVLIATVNPYALWAAPGDLYVADSGADAVVRYNPAGDPTLFGGGFNGANAVAFDSKGNVYVSDGATSGVVKITPGGVRTTFASAISSPKGIAFDRAGNLFVAAGVSITKVAPNGTKTPFASGLSSPIGLAFDKAGNLYEADGGSGNVFKFTPDGTKSTFASGFSSPNGPFGLAFDSKGNLFVSDVAAGTITKVAPNGTKTPFASGLSEIQGLAVDSSDNLLAADGADPGTIFLFTPSGIKTTFAGGPGIGAGSPVLIAFEPVLHTLLNLSNRGFVKTGDSALFAGFILGGDGLVNCRLVVRGIGPSLTAFGVPNALNDPTIEVRDAGGTLIGNNDNWKSDQQQEIQATGLAPGNDKESAILVALPAGQYTAIVRGVNNTTGNAVVELFNLQ